MPSAPAPAAALPEALMAALGQILASEDILTDADERAYYSEDVFTRADAAALVIRPRSVEQLAAGVGAVCAAGHAVVPRGGGMSYTSGYVPQEPGSVLLDLSALDRIVAVDETDMVVTVEAGVTWKQLHEALAPRGLRTPFWGTLSGAKASIGGGLSQNSVFWGSGRHGTAADSVLAMDVVTAEGAILSTGTAAHEGAVPFARLYGPDLTGLFCGDAGALGVKARITLRLIAAPSAKAFASFDFDDPQTLFTAMSAAARTGAASECFAFDPALKDQRLKRESLMADAKALAGVVRGQGSMLKGIREGVRLARAGRRFGERARYTLHVIAEGRSDAAAQADMAALRAAAEAAGGIEIENSIPKLLAANPFGPVNNMVGPRGERWVPIHALVPHSAARSAFAGIEAIFKRHEEARAEHGIETGYLFATVSSTVLLIEPVFFWPDALSAIHEKSVEAAVLKRLERFDANPSARDAVAAMRAEMIAYFAEIGAAHLQAGKAYPYADTLKPAPKALVTALKQTLDPKRRINPGALGL